MNEPTISFAGRLREGLPRVFSATLLSSFVFVATWTSSTSLLAQDLTLRFEAETAAVSSCMGSEVDVLVHMENPTRIAVAGYQVFLRFPAEFFEVVAFEPLALDSFVQIAAPAPLGDGFSSCDEGLDEAWSDGSGEDVVAVLGSAIGGEGSDLLTVDEAVLGRFTFRSRGEPTMQAGAVFRSNEAVCRSAFLQETRIFGADGQALSMQVPLPFTVRVDESGPSVEAFTCLDMGDRVSLRWFAPSTTEIAGYRIYHNNVSLVILPIDLITDFEDRDPPEGSVLYEIAVLAPGGGESCRTACTVDRQVGVRFMRGDANRDNTINIADAVFLLNHLFREGPVICQDAMDTDDSGRLNLTDALGVLNFLFFPSDANEPPPPFDPIGTDPTADDLGCDR